jgi:hypothetical protein
MKAEIALIAEVWWNAMERIQTAVRFIQINGWGVRGSQQENPPNAAL